MILVLAEAARSSRIAMDVTFNHLTKKYGDKTVVSIPDFCVKSGDILGLVGNNGAGKTTLFRMSLDLTQATEGEVNYVMPSGETINPSKGEEWKKTVGAYIDEGFLIDFLSPEEYFNFIAKAENLEHPDDILANFPAEFSELINQLMGGEILGQQKLIRDLSAGNKQKTGIISAMIGMPKLLILDEPFNFLDPSSQNALKKLLTLYNKETGATIMVSSHNLQHTIDISNRIALMEHGVIIKDLANENGSAETELEDYFAV